MIELKKEGILLKKTALGFENEGVLNPAVISDGGSLHMFYRAVAKGNYSSIGYCQLSSPLMVGERMDVPTIFPQCDYETHGAEDPRITKIDDIYYLTYTGYDGVNALGVLAISEDLIHWHKIGIIVPQIAYDEFIRLASAKGTLNDKYIRYNDLGHISERDGKKIFVWDKNVIFFPGRINGKLVFIHRIKPDIQLVSVNDKELTTEFWQHYFLHIHHNIVLSPKHEHEVSYIGGGCPPIETADGWLLIYHGVHDTVKGYVYLPALHCWTWEIH